MFIAIRKEINGSLYVDKNIYSKIETLKLTLAEYVEFKKETPTLEHTYKEAKELVETPTIVFNEETQSTEVKTTKELVHFVYVTKRVFTDEQLSQPPYNYTKIQIDDKYSDCMSSDFNEDLTFSVEKYNARKQKEIDQLRIAEITLRLEKLDQDFRQVDLGAIIPDIAERKAEFITLHNELRSLLGKPPREYDKTLA
jgi:hypothetical protein